MKKTILLIIASLILAACGGTKAPSVIESENNDKEEQEDVEANEGIPMDGEEIDYDALDLNEEDAVTDPMEAGDADNGVIFFEDDWSEFYYMKDGYVNEETDDKGFNYMEFDGFKVKYAVVLVENAYNGDESIAFFVETENNTDNKVQYNMDMEILTDNQEQINSDDMYGMGETKPNIKTKGFVKADLDYDAPVTMKITFDMPWIVVEEDDEDMDSMEASIGEEIEVEFIKE